MKLILGTVQFGLQYGINSSERPSTENVTDILSVAYDNGINTLDTSAAYGNAEQILGNIINQEKQPFQIISKYPKGTVPILEQIELTLKELKQESIYGYILHHFDTYKNTPEVWKDMEQLKAHGKVHKIGFSIYTPEQLRYIWDNNIQFDLIQFQYNLFDRQFEPYMQQLKDNSVEIHTRSTFLQGLFFKNPNALPEKLKPLKPYLEKLHKYAHEKKLSIEQVALNYNLQNPLIDKVLIGVDNTEQLQANIDAIIKTPIELNIDVKEKELLNPSNW